MEREVKISDGEKLIIRALCSLLQKDERSLPFDPVFVEAAVSGGHSWALSEILDQDKEDRIEVVDEVISILYMWFVIETNSCDFSDQEKEKLKETANSNSLDTSFEGFNLNEETEHYSVTEFLTKVSHRFSWFREREINSFSKTLPLYKRMLLNFKKVEDMAPKLNFDQIEALFKIKKELGRDETSVF